MNVNASKLSDKFCGGRATKRRVISPLLSPPANLTFSSASHTDPLNTQEIALSALTGGRGVLCVYVLRSRTLQALALGAMVAIGVEADWAKSDPTGPHPYQVAPYQDQ